MIIDSLTSLVPVPHDAVGWHARAGPDEHEVTVSQIGDGDLLQLRSPTIRTAVSGSSFASSLSAPWACEIDRISIQ